ncbi:MAG TPA: iron-sulfur cluster assembly scaffold protein [Actinomycetota bacterium]|nr:iron-sulfur cluster assembly scaffold protein [Actinomycetota bacterium]
MFSEALLDRFFHPRHVGDLPAPSASATEGNPICGDVVHIDLDVADGTVAAARFRTMGCAVAIAASEALCELVAGQPVAVAQFLHLSEIVATLGGIPPNRDSCAEAPLAAFRSALRGQLAPG